MKDDLTKLFNTMCQIETKGQSTIIMGDCLRFLEQTINNCPAEPAEAESESVKQG